LAVPLQAQYYDAAGYFRNNRDDSCTAVSTPAKRTLAGAAIADGVANIYFYPVSARNTLLSTDTTVTAASPLVGGVSALVFSRPGKAGYADIILGTPDYLRADAGNCFGQTGTSGLQDDMPCARVTFGIFKSPLIYRRENY
jgi:hypothetical protein